MPTNGGSSRWGSLPQQVLVILLGFLLWWLQDAVQTSRAQVDTLFKEHSAYRREMDDVMFRLKSAEIRLGVLRRKLFPPAVLPETMDGD